MNKQNKTILVVEDDHSLRELLVMILELEGYAVAVAKNGQQAIEFLQQQTVDMIILNLLMPVLDGMHVLHWLRVEQNSDVPVLVMTAMTDDKTASIILDSGADAIVKKPLDVSMIVKSVEGLLNQQ